MSLERTIEMKFADKLIASFIERSFHNYVTTIIGVLVILGATLGGMANAVAASLVLYGIPVHAALVNLAAVAGGVALILAKDAKVKLPTQVGIFLVLIGIFLLSAKPARAQAASSPTTPTTTSSAPALSFTASSSAIGMRLGGTTAVGTDIGETLAFTKSLSLRGDQILAPTLNFSGYYGGAVWQPDLTKVLAKTTLPANAFSLFARGAAGVSTNGAAPAGQTGTHISFVAGGGVNYATPVSLKITALEIDYLRAPGFGGSGNGQVYSAGLSFLFGK
jgi:hypothetical protein